MKIKQGKLVYIYYGIYEILNGTTTVEKKQVSKTVKNSRNSWAVSQPEAAAPLHTTGGSSLARRKNTKHHHANWGGQ